MRDRNNRTFAAAKLNKLSDLLCADPRVQSASDHDEDTGTPATSPRYSFEGMSPFNPAASPYAKSPWIHSSAAAAPYPEDQPPGLIGSLVREEGHVYSLAASGDLLYTGSESKNIRIWKRWDEYSGFKSSSGLVKAIVIAGGRIFTGHQDGKIRVWKVSPSDPTVHKRVGTLPRLKDFLSSSIKPSNYVEVRRHRSAVWLRHFDAVSCLSLDEEKGILYSGSWDKTVKVWRIADLKCLESVTAHDDAINSVVAAGGGILYTGSADGTVKQWRKELVGRRTKHVFVQTLLEQESAVTALAVSAGGSIVYSGSSDGLVNWWRRGTEMVHGGVLRGHAMAVLCLTTAGSLVITGSTDKTLCMWRRDDGEVHTRISVLAGHGGPIKCLAVQEDRDAGTGDEGWVVYSGSLDRSVKIWRVAEQPQDSVVHMSPWNTPSPSPLHVRSALHLPRVRPGGIRDEAGSELAVEADPIKVCDRVQKKTGRKVELISPLPKPPEEEKKEEAKDPPPEEKKEEPKPITVILKVRMHCEACAQVLQRRIKKMEGVESVVTDLPNDQVVVTGFVDPDKLVENVYRKTRKQAAIVKEEEKKEEEKKAEEPVKEEEKKEEKSEEEKKEEDKMEAKKFEYLPTRYYVEYAYPPQEIFSDENPNACSVM